MRILFLNHNVKGRGTYVRCFNFAKHLVRFGHSVLILTSTPEYILLPKKRVIDGVEVVSMPDILGNRFRNGGLGPIDTLLRCLYVFRQHFDLVENFDHRPVVLYPAIVAKYIRKIPLVSEWTDLHGTGGSLSRRSPHVRALIRPYEDFTEKWSKTIGEKLIVISRGLQKIALGLGVPRSRIVRIPGGADVELIRPKSKDEVRHAFGLPLDKKLIGYTGYSHYDIDMVLKAIAIIQKVRKDVWLVTTGGKLSSEAKRCLYDRKRVIELGFLPYGEYASFLPAVDVFMFPFVNKTLNIGRWPNKIGDYMAAGRPTVSNRTGDIVELFEKHKIGLLASETPEDFAEKVLCILSNHKLSEELGSNARKTAEQQYDWKFLSKQLETCLLDVIRNHRKNY